MQEPESYIISVNGIRLHYLHYLNPGKPVLLLLHGLTANCWAFEGLVRNGLCEHYELIIPDMRGRGLSTHPAFGYNFKDHTNDLLGLIKHVKATNITLVGHSYGGLLSSYLANQHPGIFTKVIFLDAAPVMNKRTPEMLQASLRRLDKIFPSKEAYLKEIKKAPYMLFWDDDMQDYYDADIATNPNKTVKPKPNLAQIMQIAISVSKEPIGTYFGKLRQPCLLICGSGLYNLGEAILPVILAEKAVAMLNNGSLKISEGNHHTMLYGKYAVEVVNWIIEFV
ncbi:MAG: alpha/beta hydrolase [Bacteroidia bacterium]|nr:alpha/beta hydrolase [Bacteroidia bacterium]